MHALLVWSNFYLRNVGLGGHSLSKALKGANHHDLALERNALSWRRNFELAAFSGFGGNYWRFSHKIVETIVVRTGRRRIALYRRFVGGIWQE